MVLQENLELYIFENSQAHFSEEVWPHFDSLIQLLRHGRKRNFWVSMQIYKRDKETDIRRPIFHHLRLGISNPTFGRTYLSQYPWKKTSTGSTWWSSVLSVCASGNVPICNRHLKRRDWFGVGLGQLYINFEPLVPQHSHKVLSSREHLRCNDYNRSIHQIKLNSEK